MSGKSQYQVINPPNTLRAKVPTTGGPSMDEMAADAEAALREINGNYEALVRDDVRRIDDAISRAERSPLAASTGIGMALEDIPKALAPFQQVDSDLNRKYEGTGLGLPLVKALVVMLGGCLDLQSEVGVSTTATVRFPAERIIAEPAMAAFARSRSQG